MDERNDDEKFTKVNAFKLYWFDQGKDATEWNKCFGTQNEKTKYDPKCTKLKRACSEELENDESIFKMETMKGFFDVFRKCHKRNGLELLDCAWVRSYTDSDSNLETLHNPSMVRGEEEDEYGSELQLWFMKKADDKQCQQFADEYLDNFLDKESQETFWARRFMSDWKKQNKDMAVWNTCFGKRDETPDNRECEAISRRCERPSEEIQNMHKNMESTGKMKALFDIQRKCFHGKRKNFYECIPYVQ